MMNVKKYRATTTRDALEMIKLELGENAFVLGTKRIRTGGFLGLRSRMQVEVSAAAAPSISVKQPMENQANLVFPSNRTLNLTDDTLAAPQFSEPANDKKRETIMSALATRAASTDAFERGSTPLMPAGEQQKIESVELNSEPPRFVYPRNEISKNQILSEHDPLSDIAENSSSRGAISDFELLRAEMREVKFSLGAFANRQNAVSRQSAVDLGVFGETFDPSFYDVYLELTATGMPEELARKSVADIVHVYKNNPADAGQMSHAAVLQTVSSLIKFQPDALQSDEATILAMVGATGVGKTTTAAKLAARVALYEHRRVELVTLDIYRIAAVEQLKTYAEIIGAGCHVVRSVFELDAVLRRLPSEATVLIDTTGRNPHDLADQYELSDYLRQRSEIRKCLVVQATTHPVDASAAIKKFELYGADCLAITKMDETMRPGAVIETISDSSLPLAYFCTGQRVPEDLQIASAEAFTNRILGKNA
jgi:flagellar biosynthesis protein FlhF